MTEYQTETLQVNPHTEGETVVVPESCFILDTNWPQPNRIVVALAVPRDETFDCGAETSGGEPCERAVQTPNARCHQHTED